MIEGRIIKGVGGLYTVATDAGEYSCNVRGIFRKKNFNPAVGDYVFIDQADEESRTGTISRFKERRTELIRPRVANIDQAVIVFAAVRPAINMDMLDRFVLLAEERGLEVLICINKTDLCNSYIDIKRLYDDIGYRTLPVSAKNGKGIDSLKEELLNKVSVFAGPSGAGKSSIVNALLEYGKMETGEISRKIGRGRHTTRHAELMKMQDGSYMVDTPGFTSLSLEHIEEDKLGLLFREFRPYIGECRFNDCRHINEPDCAVKPRVGEEISAQRYRRYTAIWNELAAKR